MKKKILVVTDVYNWIGHTRAKKLQEHLSDEFNIRIMDATEFNKWETDSNVELFTQDNFKKFIRFKGVTQRLKFSEFRNFVVNRKPKRDYDLIYLLFHTMLQKKSVQRIIGQNKVATVVTGYPTLKPCFYGRTNNREFARNKFLKLSKRCVAVGANNLKSLENLKEIYKGDTFYAPRGVDPKVFYPMRTTFERKPDDKFTVAYVGKPVPEKGLFQFIQPACETACVRLIINDRNYEDALSPEEMNEFYNQADVFVVASTIDGTPNPALESAACGKPIISNHIGNMPELIKDGVNGFLIDEMTIPNYAAKLKWLRTNQKRAFEMGMEAREAILRDWTWEKSMEYKRKIFRRLCNV